MVDEAQLMAEAAAVRAIVFAPQAPDAAIGTVTLERSTITWVGESENGSGQELAWEIQCLPHHGEDRLTNQPTSFLVAHGDVRARAGGWFVGVTTRVQIFFRDGEIPIEDERDIDALNELTRTYGGWVSHLLYDTCLAESRRLVSGVGVGNTCGITFPEYTPVPDIAQASEFIE